MHTVNPRRVKQAAGDRDPARLVETCLRENPISVDDSFPYAFRHFAIKVLYETARDPRVIRERFTRALYRLI